MKYGDFQILQSLSGGYAVTAAPFEMELETSGYCSRNDGMLHLTPRGYNRLRSKPPEFPHLGKSFQYEYGQCDHILL